MMQATINANRLSKFRSKLAAGTMYSISGFDVARCAQNFIIYAPSQVICVVLEYSIMYAIMKYLIVRSYYSQRDPDIKHVGN